MLAAEIVAHEPARKVSDHLVRRLVTVRFGRGLLRQSVHPLHHAVGLWRVGQRRPVLDAQSRTQHVYRVRGLYLCAPAVLEAVQGKLAPIVREQLLHPKREEGQTLREEVGSRFLVFMLVHREVGQARGAVNRHEAVTLLALELWQVKTVHMHEAGAVVLELPVLVGLATLLLVLLGHAV